MLNAINQIPHRNKIFILVILALIGFPIFHKLGFLGIHAWDESLFAIRAYYFSKFGESIQNFNQLGLSDFRNSKPVFMTAIQAFSYKIFGYSEFSLRFPIALSFLLTIFSLIFISIKIFKNYWIGLLAAFILISSPGMYVEHMARFGDQDIAFSLFVLLFLYFLYSYIEFNKTLHLILAFVFLYFGFYTKSIAMFLPFLGIAIYIILYNRKILKDKRLYFFLGIIIAILYFSLFEKIEHINNYKRLTETSDHEGPIYFYLRYLLKKGHFLPWLLFLPLSYKYFKTNNFIKFLIIVSSSFFVIISLAQTKLSWYAASLYPLFSLIIAFVIYHLLIKIKQGSYTKIKKNTIYLFFFILFIVPYLFSLKLILEPEILNKNNYIGNILKYSKKQFPQHKKLVILKDYHEGYIPQLEFYELLYNTEFNYQIERKIYSKECLKNEYIVCNDGYAIEKLKKRFKIDTLISFKENYLLKLN